MTRFTGRPGLSRSLVLGMALIILASPGRAQMSSEDIDAFVGRAMQRFGVVGAALGVVKDGRIVHCRGYGRRAVDGEATVDRHTNFAIASNTKAFTAAALALLVDEGKISWTDRVRRHIPEFTMYDPWVAANFTIEDLLTHRSGLGLGAGDLMFFPDGGDFTMADILAAFEHLPRASSFRTKFDYDNLLYKVAGEVIRRVTGRAYEDFVEARILRPLGMQDSVTNVARLPEDANVAFPHAADDGEPRRLDHFRFDPEKLNGAAGGIHANVDDLCRWMLLHLNEGRYGRELEKRMFSPARQREMWAVRTPLAARTDERYHTHFRGYGLGWFLHDARGVMIVSHTGGLPGMLSKTTLIPDRELGVVVLTNTAPGGGALFTAVSNAIVDSYLGLDDFGWIERLGARIDRSAARSRRRVAEVWARVEANEKEGVAVDPAAYAGVFEDPWFGRVDVTADGGNLLIRCRRSPKLNGRLRYYKANTFCVRWEYQDMNADAFVVFSLDAEGRATRLELAGISPDIDFSFDFQDLRLRRVR